MVQRLSQQVVNTFTGGLNTEAGELTFPENASVDEANCVIFRDGSRRRREGLTFEDGSVLSSFKINNDQVFSTGEWTNIGGDTDREYTVIQSGSTLYFYNKAEAPFSGSEIAQSVSLTEFEAVGSTAASSVRCDFTSQNGLLIVASSAIDTIYVEEVNNNLVAKRIDFRVRDFQFQSERSSLLEELPKDDETKERRYDSANAGWVGEKGDLALLQYRAQEDAYPPLSLPFFSGKDASGVFSIVEWKKVFAGTSLIPNGHFILDFFAKDRSTVSGFGGFAVDTETSRFSTVASFAGRVFYSGLTSTENSSVILFSQQLKAISRGSTTDVSGLGDCFQVNDPTAENFSDLLDTDGGEIRIPEAINIRKLHAFNNALFVFADNGVWQIKGSNDSFSATEFAVLKVTSVGLAARDTFISARGVPFWWSDFGIHTLGFDQQSFQPVEQNISISTIQALVDGISISSRRRMTAMFDPVNVRIVWMYPDDGETIQNKMSNLLWFDLVLQAFYPWSVSNEDTPSSHLLGAAYYRGFGTTNQEIEVADSNEDTLITSTGLQIVVEREGGVSTGESTLVFILRDGATNKVSFGNFSDVSFLDWGSANYSSFAEAGYNFLGDVMSQKSVPYIEVISKVTETGFKGSEEVGYEAVRPSSLKVSSFWDFKSSASSVAQQAYRLKHPVVVDESNLSTFTYPTDVVHTRLKLRGRGKSVKFRFESEEGKDFHLLGWAIIAGTNARF